MIIIYQLRGLQPANYVNIVHKLTPRYFVLQKLGNVLYSVQHIDSVIITPREIRYKLTFEPLEENRQDIRADSKVSRSNCVWFVLIQSSLFIRVGLCFRRRFISHTWRFSEAVPNLKNMPVCVLCEGESFDCTDGLYYCQTCGTQSQVNHHICCL